MPNAITTIRSKDQPLTIGFAGLGHHGTRIGSVNEEVHDGDTVSVRALGDFGVRLLGIDTPEISYLFPGTDRFVPLSDPRWESFLTSALSSDGQLRKQLPERTQRRLRSILETPGTAANHARWALAAERRFESLIADDIRVMKTTPDAFRMFLVFAHDILDSYGRLLCYINRDQPQANEPAPRPLSYNERLLESGAALPYFIWPNVDPWRRAASIEAAVPPPNAPLRLSAPEPPPGDTEPPPGDTKPPPGDTKPQPSDTESQPSAGPLQNVVSQVLERAREFVRRARREHRGVFDAMDPLQLEAFELRFLARREPPRRWVIDLSAADGILRPPVEYDSIPNPEDRLFIPPHYVPLFEHHGWHRG